MIVTEIKKKQNADEYEINSDGVLLCTVSIGALTQFGLHTGDEISRNTIEKINSEYNYNTAYNEALKFLSRSMRTEYEVTTKLRSKKISIDTIKKVVFRLKKNNLLDDEKYASQFVAEKFQFRKVGKKFLQKQLLQKRISKEIIQSALQTISEEEEFEQALKLAERKFQNISSLSPEDLIKEQRTMFQYLHNRGFAFSICRNVLSKIFNAQLFIDEIPSTSAVQ
ncbi:MAG: hypothetical protein FJ218_05725 [Ignavibacteria bacterium]|nr:hypothetical protein [Ignavibacteria bacterium]